MTVIGLLFQTSTISAADPALSEKAVRNDRPRPVTIMSPTNGQVVPFLNPVYVEAKPFKSDGVATQVMYFVNGQPIGTGTGQNWMHTWFATNLGPHVLTARATENGAISADSAPVRFEVQTFAPRLILLDPERIQETVEPLDGAVLRRGSTNRFLAHLDVYFPVHTLDLLVDGRKENDPREFPFLFWIPTNLGPHRLQTVVADGAGTRLTSGPVSVTIADLRPPSVTFLTPNPKSCFAYGSLVTIRARADDSHGRITNLTLVVAGQKTSSNRGPIIECTVSNVASGWHRAEVVAVNDGAQRARCFLDFFIAYELNPALPAPEAFTGEADEADSATLSWQPPPPKGALVWLTVEQKQGAGEWVDIGECSVADGEFVQGQLEAETTYAFRIAFIDMSRRRSAYSAIVEVKTPAWRK